MLRKRAAAGPSMKMLLALMLLQLTRKRAAAGPSMKMLLALMLLQLTRKPVAAEVALMKEAVASGPLPAAPPSPRNLPHAP